MNLKQYLLIKLIEEASEVIKVASKTMQFGFDSCHPDKPLVDNKLKLQQELDDFIAAIEMLNDEGLNYKPSKNNIENKKKKVVHFLGYTHQLGLIDDEVFKNIKVDEKKEVYIDDYFASKEAKTRKINELYNELIMAVESKYPDETRHETALRYIQEAQHSENESEVKCGK